MYTPEWFDKEMNDFTCAVALSLSEGGFLSITITWSNVVGSGTEAPQAWCFLPSLSPYTPETFSTTQSHVTLRGSLTTLLLWGV